MTCLKNPPWVDRILNANWDKLEAAMGAQWMPRPQRATRTGRRKTQELGCGHYGCVLPTSDKSAVFKLTSDETEAMFVVAALSLGDWPEGIVRYHRIVEVTGETYRRRRVFAVARENAFDIGFPLQVWDVSDNYIRRCYRDMASNLEKLKRYANVVRLWIQRSKDPKAAIKEIRGLESQAWDYTRDDYQRRLTGALKAAVSLQEAEDAIENMEHSCQSDLVGSALSFYLQEGLLLADVHANNVGKVTRVDPYDDSEITQNVITDPGHAVPLDTRWLSVTVDAL